MNLHIIFTTSLVVTAMAMALITCDLGAVFELVGATSACALAYILPPLCYIKLSKRSWKTYLAGVCTGFGFVVMAISLVQVSTSPELPEVFFLTGYTRPWRKCSRTKVESIHVGDRKHEFRYRYLDGFARAGVFDQSTLYLACPPVCQKRLISATAILTPAELFNQEARNLWYLCKFRTWKVHHCVVKVRFSREARRSSREITLGDPHKSTSPRFRKTTNKQILLPLIPLPAYSSVEVHCCNV